MRCNRHAGTLQTSGQSIIRSRPCSRHALIPTVPMSRSRRAVSPYGPKNEARKTFHNVLDYPKIGPWRLSDDSSGLKDSLEPNYVYRTELSLATSIRIREAASDSSSASRHPYELALQLNLVHAYEDSQGSELHSQSHSPNPAAKSLTVELL
jgi:hypothetical protein